VVNTGTVGEVTYRAVAVDDEEMLLRALDRVLSQHGFELQTFTDAEEALAVVEADPELDLAILDVNMPNVDGLQALRRIKAQLPSLPVVMLTSDASADMAVQALKAGAFNYLTKQHLGDADTVATVMKGAAAVGRLEVHARKLAERVALAERYERLVGASEPMRELYVMLDRAAQLDINLLILGESGTGKELVARAIHDRSPRSKGPFVALNCAALPETLIDSELFGHTKGAFTGAGKARAGAFERDHGGTLLLDEIGDISPAVQVRLLRVLQEGEVQRVGGDEPVKVDVRVVAATLVDLEAAVGDGEFRPDLFYRLNVMSIELPPLRQRREDIPLLAAHFLHKHCERMGRDRPALAAPVVDAFNNYHWPGNVRELENAVQRALALTPGERVELGVLPKRIAAAASRPPADIAEPHPDSDISWADDLSLSDARKLLQERFERAYLDRVLREARGNLSEAARNAGVDRSNLRRLLGRYDIRAVDYNEE